MKLEDLDPIGPETAQCQLPHKVSSHVFGYGSRTGDDSRVSAAGRNWMAAQPD